MYFLLWVKLPLASSSELCVNSSFSTASPYSRALDGGIVLFSSVDVDAADVKMASRIFSSCSMQCLRVGLESGLLLLGPALAVLP